jgi:hypothetical protein
MRKRRRRRRRRIGRINGPAVRCCDPEALQLKLVSPVLHFRGLLFPNFSPSHFIFLPHLTKPHLIVSRPTIFHSNAA